MLRHGRDSCNHLFSANEGPGVSVTVSVVIPAFHEPAHLAACIASVRAQSAFEIIVVDGGSRDDTLAIAQQSADLALTGPRGRAAQMNAGAQRAQGEILVFLHADTTLEPGGLADAVSWLKRSGVVAGCFSMRTQAEGWAYRCIDSAASARVRRTGIAYGDQGLFLARTIFQQLGGFPPLRFMEDVAFSLRLRRLGRVVVSRRRIICSARRWQRQGLIRQTLRNWTLTALAAGGVHPDQLAAYYPVVR
jgi:rSAM/selenodomain-associated transferase 2